MKTFTRVALVCGLFALTLASVVPPWTYTFDANGSYGAHSRHPAGHHLIFNAPDSERPDIRAYGVSLDFQGLFVEWIAIAAATGIAILIAPLIPQRGTTVEPLPAASDAPRYTVQQFAEMAKSLEQKGDLEAAGKINKAVAFLRRGFQMQSRTERAAWKAIVIVGTIILATILHLAFD